MKKILVVAPDSEHTPTLLANLERSGFEATAAEGCLHALTMLEWHRPDLILVRVEVEDMSPVEFCRTVRQDPLFNKVPTALVGPAAMIGPDSMVGPGSSGIAQADVFDLVLEAEDDEHVATQVCELLWRGIEASAQAPLATDQASADESHTESGDGSDLRQQISILEESVQSGLLRVETDGRLESHFLLFDHGQIVHGEVGRLHGPMALDRILLDAEQASNKRYLFEELPRWKITAYPRSIRRAESRKALGAPPDSRATREIDLNAWKAGN